MVEEKDRSEYGPHVEHITNPPYCHLLLGSGRHTEVTKTPYGYGNHRLQKRPIDPAFWFLGISEDSQS
ncbi:MAG: hypothetical protein V1878_04245 [bacterium]